MNSVYVLFLKYCISGDHFVFFQLLMSNVLFFAVPNSQPSLISCLLISFITFIRYFPERYRYVLMFDLFCFSITTVEFGPRFVPFFTVWLWESTFRLTFSLLLLVSKSSTGIFTWQYSSSLKCINRNDYLHFVPAQQLWFDIVY